MRQFEVSMRVLGAVFALLYAASPAFADPVEPPSDTQFLIKRNGDVIGYHSVSSTLTDHGVAVETDIRMRVGLGPITLFHYKHNTNEVWTDGALRLINSATNNNGDKTFVNVVNVNGNYLVESTELTGVLSLSLAPTSWWNGDVLRQSTFLSTQSGELIDVTVEEIGRTPAPYGRIALQYRVSGTLELDLWYDGDRWVGARFVIDGEELVYELADSPTQFAQLEAFQR